MVLTCNILYIVYIQLAAYRGGYIYIFFFFYVGVQTYQRSRCVFFVRFVLVFMTSMRLLFCVPHAVCWCCRCCFGWCAVVAVVVGGLLSLVLVLLHIYIYYCRLSILLTFIVVGIVTYHTGIQLYSCHVHCHRYCVTKPKYTKVLAVKCCVCVFYRLCRLLWNRQIMEFAHLLVCLFCVCVFYSGWAVHAAPTLGPWRPPPGRAHRLQREPFRLRGQREDGGEVGAWVGGGIVGSSLRCVCCVCVSSRPLIYILRTGIYVYYWSMIKQNSKRRKCPSLQFAELRCYDRHVFYWSMIK